MKKQIIELDKNDVVRMLMGIDFEPSLYNHPFCRKYGRFDDGMGGPSFRFDLFYLRKLEMQELCEAYLEIKGIIDK